MSKIFWPIIVAFLATAGLAAVADVPAFVPGSWTLVIMPDTQYYQGADANVFTSQTQWIRDNVTTRNIAYVLQEGDLTNGNTVSQWQNARSAMDLIQGVVPYAIVPGNHDCTGDRSSLLSTYFPASQARTMPTFGGTFETDNMNNSYHLFSAGGRDWIVIAMEWAPRDAVLTWANGLLDLYPNRYAIFLTHAYLYDDSTRYDWLTKGTQQDYNPNAYNTGGQMTGGVNDGEQIWQKLVKLHAKSSFVFNGHVLGDGAGRLMSTGVYGNTVHQLLANYQSPIQPTHGGNGYLRLLEFRPDGDTVQVKTYSPYLDSYLTDDQQQFVLSQAVPLVPSNPGTTNVAPTSLRFTWQDNSTNETGFKVYYDMGASNPVTLQQTTAANATYCDAVGLSSNTQYSFQVLATGTVGDSLKTSRVSAYTLSGPPSVGNNVVCDKNASQSYPVGTSFTFTNPLGFGIHGPYKVSWFRYVWDTSPTHTWSGNETVWMSGTVSKTPTAGDYYLHLRSYNSSPGLPNPTPLDYGPFRADGTPPVTSCAPGSGVYDGSVSVSLTTNEPGTIYYTTDGGTPTTSSKVYSGPISLGGDTTLKFYAVDTVGNAESPKQAVTYRVLSESGKIAEAKQLSADSPVQLGTKHLHKNSGAFGYIQEPSRESGIRVQGNAMTGLAGVPEGSVVSLIGRLQRPVGSECYILLDAITGVGPGAMHPLGTTNAAAMSPLVTGLYVKVWGTVESGSIAANSFVLNDGSSGAGLTVIADGAPGVSDGNFVTVTGAMGFVGTPVIYARDIHIESI